MLPSPNHQPKTDEDYDSIEVEGKNYKVFTHDPYAEYGGKATGLEPYQLGNFINPLKEEHPSTFESDLCTPEALNDIGLFIWQNRIDFSEALNVPGMPTKVLSIVMERLAEQGGKYIIVPEFRPNVVTIGAIRGERDRLNDVLYQMKAGEIVRSPLVGGYADDQHEILGKGSHIWVIGKK